MLTLTRRPGERIVVFHESDPEPLFICVTPAHSGNHRSQFRVNLEANPRYIIHREEIYRRIIAEAFPDQAGNLR